jgi:hypothetical protein
MYSVYDCIRHVYVLINTTSNIYVTNKEYWLGLMIREFFSFEASTLNV